MFNESLNLSTVDGLKWKKKLVLFKLNDFEKICEVIFGVTFYNNLWQIKWTVFDDMSGDKKWW